MEGMFVCARKGVGDGWEMQVGVELAFPQSLLQPGACVDRARVRRYLYGLLGLRKGYPNPG